MSPSGSTIDGLRALQLDRLQQTLQLVYETGAALPAGVRRQAESRRDDLRSLDDLARFPFTTKQTCATTTRSGCSPCRARRRSGSMRAAARPGAPTVVGYTQADVDMWADVVARSIRAAGGRRGDLMHVAYGYGLFTGGLGAHYGAERLGCTVVPVSGGMTERQVQLITDFRPRIIMVTPSYFLAIVDEMERQGIDPATVVARDRHLRRRAVDRRDAT